MALFQSDHLPSSEDPRAVMGMRGVVYAALVAPFLLGLVWLLSASDVDALHLTVATVAGSAMAGMGWAWWKTGNVDYLKALGLFGWLLFANVWMADSDTGVSGSGVSLFLSLVVAGVALFEAEVAWTLTGLVLINLAGWWAFQAAGFFPLSTPESPAGPLVGITVGCLWFASVGYSRSRIARQRLVRERRLRDSLFAGLPECLFVLRGTDPILVEASYGPADFPLQVQVGLLGEVLSPELAKVLEEGVREVRDGGGMAMRELRVQDHHIQARLSVVDRRRVAVQLHDATVTVSARVAAERAARAAEEFAASQQRFLATMSHEVRTPLHAITGLADILQGSELPSVARSRVDLLQAASRTLLGMIDHILDFNRLELGGVRLELAPTDIRELLSQVVDPAAEVASDLALGWVVGEGVPDCVMLDRARTLQIIANLVGNAVKFSAGRPVSVEASWSGEGGPGSEGVLSVVVRDQGIGMDAGVLERIRDPFVQAEQGPERAFGGTGLGLAISTRLATLMGGELQIESELGVGTTCTLVVPSTVGSAAMEPARERSIRASSRVLLVDDNPTNRVVMNLMLQPLGVEVVEAEHGEEALRLAEEQAFDLVLMDLHMPLMDGLTASRTMRDRGLSMPILAVTADAIRDVREEVEAAGMSGMLTKPVGAAALRDAVIGCLAAEPGDSGES